MSLVDEEKNEVKPGDMMTTDELLDALDRRNCRYLIAIQTENKNDSESFCARVEMTKGMMAFEAVGLAELIHGHCRRWLDRIVASVGSDEDE